MPLTKQLTAVIFSLMAKYDFDFTHKKICCVSLTPSSPLCSKFLGMNEAKEANVGKLFFWLYNVVAHV
jgi:hypothetical protein